MTDSQYCQDPDCPAYGSALVDGICPGATVTVKQLAAEAYSCFETAHRGDRVETDAGEYIRVKDGSPEWVTDLVHAGHGEDFRADDYRYRWIMEACECISEADDPEDAAHEFADYTTDVYTGRLLEWLSSNLQRIGYVDEMCEEMGIQADGGIVRMISVGQYEEIRETFELVWQFLQDRSDHLAPGVAITDAARAAVERLLDI